MRDLYYELMKWLTKDWWNYLLEKPTDPYYTNWWNRLNCRRKGHPCGPWYFNIGLDGVEPDMHCRNCGDLIG